jgi:hypothetical protein
MNQRYLDYIKDEYLKPCPCCGASAIRKDANIILCSNMLYCGIRLNAGDYLDMDEMVVRTRTIWNRRA